uniref:Dolichyl-diphosphooligosaccharide-protein glycosyltransferase subunit TMEM258 n=1 Tax=Timema monikensis TaxID=170555 RepID=A0A7R9HM88_9NEOP|nr:unnamed protein product [Timema monikensis]
MRSVLTENVALEGKLEAESMIRYVSPVNPAVFPHLTVVLLGIGIFFTAWFFVYEVTSTKFTRHIFKELLVALVAAIFSGFGVLFLLLMKCYTNFTTQSSGHTVLSLCLFMLSRDRKDEVQIPDGGYVFSHLFGVFAAMKWATEDCLRLIDIYEETPVL